MPLINCEISLILTRSSTCFITNSTGAGTFALTDTKLNVPAVTLLTQDSAKLLPLLKSGFKITNNWNKYQSKATLQTENPYLDYLVDPSFQGEIRLFVLPFEDNTHRTRHTGYFLPKVEIKDYNVLIDGQNFFDQSLKNDLRTYHKICKDVNLSKR